ncbi:MAG: hypothetical protein AAGF12_10700 [Myxococcota bacterium]
MRSLAALLLLLGACGGEDTYVDVWFDADEGFDDADGLRVRVFRAEGALSFDEARRLQDIDLPASIRLEPENDDASREFRIEGELQASDRVLSTVRAYGRYVAGEGRILRLRFRANCRDVVCDARETCGSEGACRDACVTFGTTGTTPCEGVADAGMDARDAAPEDGGQDDDATLPAPRVQQALVTSFTSDQSAFVPVPGGSLTVTTGTERWLVLIGASLDSTSATPRATELRYLVDGTVRGNGGTPSASPGGGGPFLHFVTLPPGGSHTIRVEVRAGTMFADAEANVRNLQIVAVPIPTAGELVETETLRTGELRLTPSAFEAVESLTVNPSRPGRYLVLAVASASEIPGLTGATLRVSNGGEVWPAASAGELEHLSSTTDDFQTLYLARAPMVTGPTTFSLELRSAMPSSTLGTTRIVAFRTDAFASYESVEELAIGAPPAALTVTPEAPREYVVLQSLTLAASGTRQLTFEAAGQAVSFDHRLTDATARVSYGAFFAPLRAGAFTVRNSVASAGEVKESVIHVLGL